MSEIVDHTPLPQPEVDIPREESLAIQIQHWEERAAELDLARRLAIGQLQALYQERSLMKIRENTNFRERQSNEG